MCCTLSELTFVKHMVVVGVGVAMAPHKAQVIPGLIEQHLINDMTNISAFMV